MRYKITSAAFANPEHTAAILQTAEAGTILIGQDRSPDEWAAMLALGEPDDYIEPAPPIPDQVSSAQAKLALDAAGILDDVETMIAAHPVRAVRIWFADANVWERSHPYVSALGLEMSLDDAAIDALFAAADRF